MGHNYMLITEQQLRMLLALSHNRTLNDYDVRQSDKQTFIEFYVDDKDEDAEPAEIIKLDEAQTLGEIRETKENVKYLLNNPASSIDFHNIQYWATRLNELRGQLQNEN